MNELLLLLSLIEAANRSMEMLQKVSAQIQKARAEGRQVTHDELMALAGEDDIARDLLDQAIMEAQMQEESGPTG